MTFYKIFSILAATFLLSCNYQEHTRVITIKNNIIKNNKRKISETWLYSFPFYSSRLIINPDTTFSIVNEGCTGKSFTSGKWSFKDNLLILNSFSKDKKEKMESNLDSIILCFNDLKLVFCNDTLYELDECGMRTKSKYSLSDPNGLISGSRIFN